MWGNVLGEVKKIVGGGEGVEKVREICGEMCWGVGR